MRSPGRATSLTTQLSRLLLVTLCLGADCFPAGGGSDGGYVGPGSPSLELTVDGSHVGPAPAGADAYADLTGSYDDRAQLVATDLVLHGTGGGATCDIHVQRYGTGVLPFHAGAYQLLSSNAQVSPDGTVSVVGPILATAGALSIQCNGSQCDGSVIDLAILDGAHVEGYVSTQLTDYVDSQTSSVVCSFYLPWRKYSP